jgi:ABC-type dipeptide/oligopeptide/nickel transport system permease subunit
VDGKKAKISWRDTVWYINITSFLREFSRHKIGLLGIIGLAFFIGMAIVAPYLVQYSPSPNARVAGDFLAPSWMQFFDPGGVVTHDAVQDPELGLRPDFTVNGTSPAQFSYDHHISQGGSDFNRIELTWTHDANQTLHFRTPLDSSGNLPDCLDFVYFAYTFEWTYDRLPSNVNMTVDYAVNMTGDFASTTDGGLLFKAYVWLIDSSGNWIKIYQSYPPYFAEYQQRRAYLNYFDILDGWQGIIDHEDPSNTLTIAVGLAPSNLMRLDPTTNGSVTVSVKRLSIITYGKYFGLLGTTDSGADAWSQLVYGSRVSITIGVTATALSSMIGVAVGLSAGYFGGKVDELLMRFVDFLLVIPGLPLMMVLAAFFGRGMWTIIIVISILGWTGTSRLIRSQVMAEKNKAYVESARAIGASDTYIMWRHILPNVTPLLFADITLGVVGAILSESGLAFLGLTDPDAASWGRMLADAQNSGGFSNGAWWVVVFPGLMITLLSLSFTFVGHTLDEVLNPRLRER